MGIFGRQDELFEIMAKQKTRARNLSRGTTPSTPTNQTPSVSTTRPRYCTGPLRDELIEVDGDALVVIDDEDWITDPETLPEESEPSRVFNLRADTAAVGGGLLAGVVALAFLIGRTTGAPVETTPPVVQVAVTDAQPAETPTTTTVPVSTRQGEATTLRASAPRTAKPAPSPEVAAVTGSYELIVVSTTEAKATAVVEWLNTNARSPIFGRTGLQAFARKGGVRIRGFAKREGDVEKRVRATADPTNGGSGTFNDAYYVKAR